MNSLWSQNDNQWQRLSPTGFEDEAALHRLVEAAPHMLPLSGSPRLAVVGREVLLGSGYADLVAIETCGRPVVIEVKLARNPEARRAVIGQVLAYASILFRMDLDTFEQVVLRKHLEQRGYASLADAIETGAQEVGLERPAFNRSVTTHLAEGGLRLVLVLDDSPTELVGLVGFLESISREQLVVDLITVSAYDVNGSRILVPRRVTPDLLSDSPRVPNTSRAQQKAVESEGSNAFAASIESMETADREGGEALCRWAVELQRAGLARLISVQGKGRTVMRVLVTGQETGLVTAWNERGASVSLWRSVFEKMAANTLHKLEGASIPVGQGNVVRYSEFPPRFLEILTEAYCEAAGRS